MTPGGLSVETLAEYVTVEGECWTWAKCLNPAGYGFVRFGGRTGLAHRVVYALLIGEPPAGTTMDHLCRNRACVNPDHLEPVPHAVNLRRGNGRVGINSRKSHCDRGHPFDDANTYIHPQRGNRHCKACHRLLHRKASTK